MIYIAVRFSRFPSGKRCSLHFHQIKTESFYLRTGRLKVYVKHSPTAEGLKIFELKAGECMDIPRGVVHQMEALEDSRNCSLNFPPCTSIVIRTGSNLVTGKRLVPGRIELEGNSVGRSRACRALRFIRLPGS